MAAMVVRDRGSVDPLQCVFQRPPRERIVRINGLCAAGVDGRPIMRSPSPPSTASDPRHFWWDRIDALLPAATAAQWQDFVSHVARAELGDWSQGGNVSLMGQRLRDWLLCNIPWVGPEHIDREFRAIEGHDSSNRVTACNDVERTGRVAKAG